MGEPTTRDPFTEHRGLLFTVAYEMLGSVTDAEDVLQESWLRWNEVDQSEVQNPRAYVVRIVTRQALNRLRTLRRQRESYVGTWLPEPLVTGPDVLDDVELADSVSFAMLVVLERLSPLERAVFVLREVFGFDFDEIAVATDRSPEAVRQLASRARRHVREQRPRPVSTEDPRPVVERFVAATLGGELQPLMDLLAPDVVLLTDGGGKKQAALRPIHGAEKVARFMVGINARGGVPGELRWGVVNGAPSLFLSLDGELDSVFTLEVRDGRITELYGVRNPDKLHGVDVLREIGR